MAEINKSIKGDITFRSTSDIRTNALEKKTS